MDGKWDGSFKQIVEPAPESTSNLVSSPEQHTFHRQRNATPAHVAIAWVPSHGSCTSRSAIRSRSAWHDHTTDRLPYGFEVCGSEPPCVYLGGATRPLECRELHGLAEQCFVRPARDFFDEARNGIAGKRGSQLANDGFAETLLAFKV